MVILKSRASKPSLRLRNVIKNGWREDMIEKDVCRLEAWYWTPPCPPYTFWCSIMLKRIGMASKGTRDVLKFLRGDFGWFSLSVSVYFVRV